MAAQPTFSVTFSSWWSASTNSLHDFRSNGSLQLQTMVIERDIGGTVEVVTATVTVLTAFGPRVAPTGEFRVKEGRMLAARNGRLFSISVHSVCRAQPLRATDLTGMYSTMRIQTGKALVSGLGVYSMAGS